VTASLDLPLTATEISPIAGPGSLNFVLEFAAADGYNLATPF
jgi:hypothetical protein